MSHKGENRFDGVFSADVIDNDDSNAEDKHKYLGRLRVRIDQVYGKKTQDSDCPWAWPAAMVWGADKDQKPSGLFVLPSIGSTVAVVFEHGDPERPFWIGNFWGERPGDLKPEISKLNIEDGRSGVKYPNIVTVKGVGAANKCFLRILGDNRIELVYEQDTTYVEIDSQSKLIHLCANTAGWNIQLDAPNGNVTVNAQNFTVNASQTVMINAGADAMLATAGNLLCEAGGDAMFGAAGAIYGAAPTASGFDRHQPGG